MLLAYCLAYCQQPGPPHCKAEKNVLGTEGERDDLNKPLSSQSGWLLLLDMGRNSCHRGKAVSMHLLGVSHDRFSTGCSTQSRGRLRRRGFALG
jgi:hypothetical protein